MTTLQSTCNSKVMGTKIYMAPEIILHKKNATDKSDIWSLACTILEIYKEDVIWDVESEDELIHKFLTRTKILYNDVFHMNVQVVHQL
ncbi:hypothetical protein TSAR_010140 [Trichomalopsis sarcophagae]|uniref:Protein kinase domain-containing protein n=1 Tax=Trichomalopsis sarcophagae TaxID=543379 RepID=A0A232EZS8_9HYME|nr:hypothetical protein TSAR_010140 [Trichomalopsis sarcophagae]